MESNVSTKNKTTVSGEKDDSSGATDQKKREVSVDNDTKNAGKWKQYFAAFTVCIGSFGSGFSTGWASPMLLILNSDDSPVGKMSLDQMGYLESLPQLTGLACLYLYGAAVDKYGRKITGYLSIVPALIGFTLIIVASEPIHLYIGRSLTGIYGVGIMTAGPAYLSEVTHETRRGTLLAFIMAVANVGTLTSSILGDALSYVPYNCVGLVSPILFSIIFFWLPESPYFLVSKSKVKEAEKSFRWYMRDSKENVTAELRVICNMPSKERNLSEMLKSRCFRRSILIVVFMFSFTQLGGASIINGYASVIFEDAGSTMHPNKAVIIIFAIKTIATHMSSLLVDRVGRRPLIMSSFLSMGISLTILTGYFIIKESYGHVTNYAWLPLAVLCAYNVAIAIGVGTLSEVVSSEIVPPEIKGKVSMISGTITLSVMALCLHAFPFIHAHVGAYGNFVYPAFFNFLGAVITYLILPETKGKPLAEILENMNS